MLYWRRQPTAGINILLLFVFVNTFSDSLIFAKPSNLHEIFLARTNDDWRGVWHSEKIQRCYEDLIGHMNWACQKDIYKLVKRNDDKVNIFKRFGMKENPAELEENDESKYLNSKEAFNVFSSKLVKKRGGIRKRGIMDECCAASGCSWEEYAEYCPTNKRIRGK